MRLLPKWEKIEQSLMEKRKLNNNNNNNKNMRTTYFFFGTLSFQTKYREVYVRLLLLLCSLPEPDCALCIKSRLFLRGLRVLCVFFFLFICLFELILLCHIHYFYNCCCHCLFSVFDSYCS